MNSEFFIKTGDYEFRHKKIFSGKQRCTEPVLIITDGLYGYERWTHFIAEKLYRNFGKKMTQINDKAWSIFF